MMYAFTTIWRLEADLESVWTAIKESESWPEWWRGVRSVEMLREGDETGVGAVYHSLWRSALPYSLSFDSEVVRIEELKLIEIRAFGELEGSGLWTLIAESDSLTRVRYDWQVTANKRWMTRLAPILKPFFRWNHDVIMAWGGEGLARKLNCKLLETR